MADEYKHSKKEKKAEKNTSDHKIWYFIASPAYFFLVEVPLHEASHAFVVGVQSNWDLTSFKPYPHYIGETFVFGSIDIRCSGGEPSCPDPTGYGLINVAPYIRATASFAISDLLLSTKTVEPTSVTGRVLYFAGMVIPWYDLAHNLDWRKAETSDINHISKGFKIPLWSVVATGATISGVGLWRLWKGYKRAFPKRNKQRMAVDEPNLVIVPMSESKTLGISLRMSF